MDIGVIGGGAIGLLLSSYLCSNHNVTVYVRRDQQKEQLNKKGLIRTDSSKPILVESLLIDEIKKEDCFIICVKQTHLSDIFSKISKINECTPLIFLQNGMGHIEQIKHLKQPLFLGVVDHGAIKIEDHIVSQTGKGKIKLAAYPKRSQQLDGLVNTLNQSDFPMYAAEEGWSPLLAEKLIVNAVINPITALFDVSNGAILHNPYIYMLAEKVCKEAASVLDLDFNEQWKRTQEVAQNTEKNISSMLMDIKEKRETEIEAITGYLLRKEEKKLIPNTWFLHYSIKALEVKRG